MFRLPIAVVVVGVLSISHFSTPGIYMGASVDAEPDGFFLVGAVHVGAVANIDFGDAPDPAYPTLLINDGARHAIVAGVHMGTLIDDEPDALPDTSATGDDLDALMDEDGVIFTSPLIASDFAMVDVDVSQNGNLDAWIDFDQSGSWDASELIYSGSVATGINTLNFLVPGKASLGKTFARFRYNTSGVSLAPTGYAPSGEVEDYEVLIEEYLVANGDFGDAPDPTYATLLVSDGPRHEVTPGIYMGATIDGELDGQPDANALGDDSVNLSDEDGVTFPQPLEVGSPSQLDVIVSLQGWLDVWIDFDLDGVFTPADLVYSNTVGAGFNSILFNVPHTATAAAFTFVRVRYNTNGPLNPYGAAVNGEVEDYEVMVDPPGNLDFGDAPDSPYPTLVINDGARHLNVPGIHLGALIDGEPDGWPDAAAMGDDGSNLDDEDGVVFITPLSTSYSAQVVVTASVPGHLDAWFDLTQDGVWQLFERLYSGSVNPGANNLYLTIPPSIPLGPTFARFRFNTGSALAPTGYAMDGEVEDYEVTIDNGIPLEDFGDAPDPGYATTLANNGPRHTVNFAIYLGALVDPEYDGQPNPNATGDDIGWLADDDGVTFVGGIVPGQPGQIDVLASVSGHVDIWIDYDFDGVFTPSDQVFSGPVAAGLNPLPYSIPGLTPPGVTFSRIRFHSGAGPLPSTGPAGDGEVEDYEVTILPPPLDFGDAPDGPYATLFASGGAHHVVVPNVYMGTQVDSETDGQPDPNATGDDNAGAADEDGLSFVTALTKGQNAQIDVTASQPGWLDMWIDYDQNGVWDPPELVYSGSVFAGVNNIPFVVSGTAPSGVTYLRARYSTGAALPPTGPAGNGEVEDYEVLIQSVTGVEQDQLTFRLLPASPNPFRGFTALSFDISEPGPVSLKVFTIDGRLAATLLEKELAPGSYEQIWKGLNNSGKLMPSGVYFIRLTSGEETQTHRVVHIK